MRTRARTIALHEETTGRQGMLPGGLGILGLAALVQITVLVIVAGLVR